jgi:FKBP-type peptidyl-prolyl cis-trans isomerase
MHRLGLTTLFLITSLLLLSGCGGGGGEGAAGGGGKDDSMSDTSDKSASDAFELETKPGIPSIGIEVVKRGEGDEAAAGKVATVHYALSLPGGPTIESSRESGRPFDFRLGVPGVIEGWQIVVSQMRVGDRWKATIPYQLAYGDRGSPPDIPPRATLVFDMELMALR